ncbi:MAG: AEC family transporter [Eubacteriales bacterium]|nr:AEC family transporter [Eubacteriales bacterium]
MLENFLFSVNVVLPLFFCCLVGFIARERGWIAEPFLSGCSHIVFYIAIPANIFLSISGDDLGQSFSFPLLLYIFAAIVLLSAVCVLAVPRIIRNPSTAATVAVTVLRGNFAMLGIPLALSLMGREQAGPTLVMIPFATMLYTVVSVFLLVLMGSPGGADGKRKRKGAMIEVLHNPLIIASAASILVAISGISLPTAVNSTIRYFADMTTGLSLIMLGAQLNVREAFTRLRYSIPATILRLVVLPLIVVTPAVFLGFRGPELACIFIFFATPTAINSYILAGRLGGDGKLAGDIVLATSCLSTITLMAGIFLLKSLHLF